MALTKHKLQLLSVFTVAADICHQLKFMQNITKYAPHLNRRQVDK